MASLLVLGLASLGLAAGCGSNLSQYTSKMDRVEVTSDKMITGARIDTGNDSGPGALGTVKKATGGAAAVKLKKKFVELFDGDDIRALARTTVEDALGDGPPFAAAEDGEGVDGKLNVTVYSYGIEQDGGEPAFFTLYKTKIFYTGDGGEERVWKDNYQCHPAGFWDFSHVGQDVAFMKAVMKMDDKDFKEFVRAGFKTCSENLVERIREAAKE